MVEIRASLPTAAIAAVFDIDTVELCAANISSLLTALILNSKTAKTLSLPPRTEKMKPEDQHPGGSTWWVNVRL